MDRIPMSISRISITMLMCDKNDVYVLSLWWRLEIGDVEDYHTTRWLLPSTRNRLHGAVSFTLISTVHLLVMNLTMIGRVIVKNYGSLAW